MNLTVSPDFVGRMVFLVPSAIPAMLGVTNTSYSFPYNARALAEYIVRQTAREQWHPLFDYDLPYLEGWSGLRRRFEAIANIGMSTRMATQRAVTLPAVTTKEREPVQLVLSSYPHPEITPRYPEHPYIVQVESHLVRRTSATCYRQPSKHFTAQVAVAVAYAWIAQFPYWLLYFHKEDALYLIVQTEQAFQSLLKYISVFLARALHGQTRGLVPKKEEIYELHTALSAHLRRIP